MHFTFGKHAGKLITDVINTDVEYIQWLVKNGGGAHNGIAQQIEYAKTVAAPVLEALEQRELKLRDVRRPLLEPAIKAMKAVMVINKLKKGREATPWWMGVFDSVCKGVKISAYAQELIADACGKSQGRRNSNKYKTMKNIVEQSFNQAYNLSMQTVTITNITYEPQDGSLPDNLTFEFDEAVDQAYLNIELKSHIQEYIQESFNTTSVVSNFEFAAE